MKRLLLLSASLSLLACPMLACSNLFGDPDPGDAAAVARAPEGQGTSAWLAWSVDDQGHATTAWLDASGQELARRDGVVVAWGGQIWTLQASEGHVQSLDCDCVLSHADAFSSGEPPADCQVTAAVEQAALVTTDGKARQDVMAAPGDRDPWAAAPQRHAAVLGAAGPYVFLQTCSNEYSCGAAHGGESCSFAVYDLRAPQTPAAPLAPQEQAGVLASLGPAAQKALQEPAEGAAPDAGAPGVLPAEGGDLELTTYYPTWDPGGGPHMVYQLTGPACHACSDGLWGSDTRSSRQTADPIPAALAEHVQPAPPPVRQWWAAQMGALRGFSALEGGVALATFQGKP